jgi:hypothetical protein
MEPLDHLEGENLPYRQMSNAVKNSSIFLMTLLQNYHSTLN